MSAPALLVQRYTSSIFGHSAGPQSKLIVSDGFRTRRRKDVSAAQARNVGTRVRSAEGAQYSSQGQALSGAKRVAPG